MKPKVVVLAIKEYDLDLLQNRILAVLSQHFPLSEYFSKQDKILLKPNMLMDASPDEAVATHPLFVEAVGRIFKAQGFSVSLADSPGGFITNRDMPSVYQACGYQAVAERNGFDLLYPKSSFIQDGLPLCWWADGSFKMINLPKLKTHELMTMTLAVKNLYGCISGMHKSQLHINYPKPADFVQIILKLNGMIKPSLNIVDGILALEGPGPAKKGKPRHLGWVVIGNSALYTDLVISRLVGLNDQLHPLIKYAKLHGLLDEKQLTVINPDKIMPIANFKIPSSAFLDRLPAGLANLLTRIIKFYPKVNKEECRACLICIKVCPKHAISLIETKANINYKKCIKCLCCAEMCKFGAIDLDKNWFLKFLKILHNLTKSIVFDFTFDKAKEKKCQH